ncbi:hypothetical protein KM295_14335 [Natronomonas sp. F2-12]|uniref:Uncharacterized protein n=1 Tax=Natronomonas aquatica TaxID=2841590 RepID=A0A9R1D5S3_9EURY|nr:hypothetical protein [Natronomonas aquatica]MCQ4334634.1 hypothetical protein [Natronomonas aquatica]
MQANDLRPDKKSGHGAAIDVQARLEIIERQRRIILEATDDDRLRRCMRLLGCDLVATQRDFQRASELPETAHEGLLTGGAGDRA